MSSPEYCLHMASSFLKDEEQDCPVFDPALLVRFFLHHEIAPSIYHSISDNPEILSQFTMQQQKRMYNSLRNARMRYSLVSGALKDAITLLEPLDPLLFKGIALGEYYPNPWLRNPGDIDLMVRRGDFMDAESILANNGWIKQPTVHWQAKPEIAKKFGFALVFRHPTRPVIIDLHRELVDRTEPFQLNQDKIFTYSFRKKLQSGITIRVPELECHLVIAALHSVRHGFFRLSWFYDLYRMSRLAALQFNRGKFVKLCQMFSCTRAVKVAISLADRVFEQPSTPSTCLADNRWTRWAVSRRDPATLFRGHMVTPGSIRRISAMLDLLDSPAAAAAYLARVVFPHPQILYPSHDAKKWYMYPLDRLQRLNLSFQFNQKD